MFALAVWIAAAGCGATRVETTSAPVPASSFPSLYRCLASETPPPQPLPWPGMEVDPDAESLLPPYLPPERYAAETIEERCRRYGEEARVAMARGQRPFIHLDIQASQSKWGCPEVLMQYMPYAGDSYQVPIPGDRWSGCDQSPISDLPSNVTNERDGVAWTMKTPHRSDLVSPRELR